MSTSIQVLGEERPFFHLRTATTSVVLRVGPFGHLEQLWWGAPLGGEGEGWPSADELAALWHPVSEDFAQTTHYSTTSDSSFALAKTPLAWATLGKGDPRVPGLRVREHQVLDATYVRHEVRPGLVPAPGLPRLGSEERSETLVVTLADRVAGLEVDLFWTTFPLSGVLTRRTVVRNTGAAALTLEHVASLVLDLAEPDVDVLTLDGHWLSEAHGTRRPVGLQQVVNSTTLGTSSDRHNPGFLLPARGASETHGECWGVNLAYSGSHWSSIQGDSGGMVRVVAGLNPDGFAWSLAPGEQFCAPEAVLAHSSSGLNGVSASFHRFVDDCVVPAHWRRRERPVVLNNWEGTYFDFDADVLVQMAERAAELGVETFVLDDGWFGERHDDQRALGDWHVNTDKLPGGLGALAERIAEHGLAFGLWVEPEAISPNSDLFRAHPDWAITTPGRTPSQGRHELLLDLTRPDVRDHLVETLGSLFDSAPISFVKWDFNRAISDADEAGFHHRYVLGLYDVLGRVFGPRPEILLENCSSGGSRFDLGMLTFGPQVWASDCTDPAERLAIQHGLSLLYPPSTISAHASDSPNHQTDRVFDLAFRCDVALPYVFGIELDPRAMSEQDTRLLTERIAWYREHRAVLQFGASRRTDHPANLPQLARVGDEHAIAFAYATYVRPRQPSPRLVIPLGGQRVGLSWPFAAREDETLPGAAARAGILRSGRQHDTSAEVVHGRRLREQ